MALGAEKAVIKPKFYPVLEMAIENGVTLGLAHAHKYDERPSLDVLHDHITREIIAQIYEWFDVKDENYAAD